ncbi:MAG: hypothetical protein J6W79_01730 [Alphaproteobacteria bacterium]|nr:hypothetical protein [Alphaproteobacteria bacterium]
MAKPSDDKKNKRKQQFTDALDRLKGIADKEQHMAIANLLATGDEFSQSLVLFDIIIDTDTVQSLLVQDDVRIKTLCDFYKIKLSDDVRDLLLSSLKQSRRSRRTNVLLKSGVQKERETFVREIETRYSVSQRRSKQK